MATTAREALRYLKQTVTEATCLDDYAWDAIEVLESTLTACEFALEGAEDQLERLLVDWSDIANRLCEATGQSRREM